MSNQSYIYGCIGLVVTAVVSVILVLFIIHSSRDSDSDSRITTDPSEAPLIISEPAADATSEIEPAQESTAWHCVDATSYNQNAYDDNKCTNGSETQYVSDSQAIELDPGYTPGKAGASYYNNQ